jgi:hypothetical protein
MMVNGHCGLMHVFLNLRKNQNGRRQGQKTADFRLFWLMH